MPHHCGKSLKGDLAEHIAALAKDMDGRGAKRGLVQRKPTPALPNVASASGSCRIAEVRPARDPPSWRPTLRLGSRASQARTPAVPLVKSSPAEDSTEAAAKCSASLTSAQSAPAAPQPSQTAVQDGDRADEQSDVGERPSQIGKPHAVVATSTLEASLQALLQWLGDEGGQMAADTCDEQWGRSVRDLANNAARDLRAAWCGAEEPSAMRTLLGECGGSGEVVAAWSVNDPCVSWRLEERRQEMRAAFLEQVAVDQAPDHAVMSSIFLICQGNFDAGHQCILVCHLSLGRQSEYVATKESDRKRASTLYCAIASHPQIVPVFLVNPKQEHVSGKQHPWRASLERVMPLPT